MGVYLSKPITEKVSSDYQNSWLKCGVSSMQGWRASQEDAHNCCLDYDEDCSFFAVYDGHGGHEVAEYTAKYFPRFLKKVEAYKDGEFEKALEDAFIDFDNTLKDETVVNELKAIAVNKSSSDAQDNSEDEVDVQELREEARMPLNDLIAKYTSGSVKAAGVKSVLAGESSGLPASPYLRAKAATSGAGSSKDSEPPLVNGTAESNGEVASKSSEDCETTKDSPDKGSSSKDSSEGSTSVNGEHATDSKEEEKKSVEEEQKKVGSSSVAEEDEDEQITMKSVIRVAKKKATVTLLAKLFESNDSESDSSNDESFLANDTSVKDDEDDIEDEGDGEEEDEEDEEGGDEEAEEEEDSDDETVMCDTGSGEVAGSDSGCTAVAALVRGTKVYVANAGDSRAVLCRAGKAVDLSVDHKPDDEAEMARITAAGGRVTSDGRVNGGLNLSRALGDHSYKQCESMDAKSQMITALPDIQVQDIDPSQDEFLVLACDGIWNSMSSQEVVDFVKPLIEKEEKLSTICGKLFDNCLAPDTMGDGTGCDNMTCIIVRFCERAAGGGGEPSATEAVTEPSAASDASKRPASPSSQDSNKRPKVESQSS